MAQVSPEPSLDGAEDTRPTVDVYVRVNVFDVQQITNINRFTVKLYFEACYSVEEVKKAAEAAEKANNMSGIGEVWSLTGVQNYEYQCADITYPEETGKQTEAEKKRKAKRKPTWKSDGEGSKAQYVWVSCVDFADTTPLLASLLLF